MAKKTKEQLERKLGQLAYEIGKLNKEANILVKIIERLQTEATQVATEIESLG